MKTIDVTDEMYEFLMNLSKELNTQSHRGTRMPYFFQVQETKQIAVPEGNGNEAWHCDGTLLKTKDEIKEIIYDIKEWYDDNDSDNERFDDLDEDDIIDILETNGWYKVNYDYERVLSNAFLTEKACKEHIEANAYNYTKPRDYLSYASRNDEMETLQQFLCEISGGKLHR